MTLYYYMYRSWQDCCRRGENRSWPFVSVESVDSEYWCLNNAIVYSFTMRLTVEERVLRSTFKLNTLYNNLINTARRTICLYYISLFMLFGFLAIAFDAIHKKWLNILCWQNERYRVVTKSVTCSYNWALGG